jgi:hypothetical protein
MAIQAAANAELRAAPAPRAQVVTLEATNTEPARGMGGLEVFVAELERRPSQGLPASAQAPSPACVEVIPGGVHRAGKAMPML